MTRMEAIQSERTIKNKMSWSKLFLPNNVITELRSNCVMTFTFAVVEVVVVVVVVAAARMGGSVSCLSITMIGAECGDVADYRPRPQSQ